jgi:hypothetical protein
VDPDGNDFYNLTDKDITVKLEKKSKEGKEFVVVHPGEVYKGLIDGAILDDDTVIKVSGRSPGVVIDVVVETIDGKDTAFLLGINSIDLNYRNDLLKAASNFFAKLFSKKDEKLFSGVYDPIAVEKHPDLQGDWVNNSKKSVLIDDERKGVRIISEEEKKDIKSNPYKYRMFDQE